MKKFNYTADIHYQIGNCYLTDSFDQLGKATDGLDMKNRRLLFITEKLYFGFYKEQISALLTGLSKTFDVFEIESAPCNYAEESEKLLKFAAEIGLDENDCVVSFGGCTADALSKLFIASLDKTLLYIQIPLTFTAQLIAGKELSYVLEVSQANYGDLKEKVFKIQPELIYINIHSYKYLSQDERLSGMGEVLRHAVASDKPLFEYIESNTGNKTDNFSAFLMLLIGNSLESHEASVKQDGWEAGTGRLPIYGYTIARALEKCTNFIIPHGSATGIGMVVANSIAAKRGLISDNDNFRIARQMVSYGLSVSMNFTNELIEAICSAVQSEEGLVDENETLKEFVLIDKIGHTKTVNDVTLDEIKDVMNYRKVSH